MILPASLQPDTKAELAEQLQVCLAFVSNERSALRGISSLVPPAAAFSGSHGLFRRKIDNEHDASALIMLSEPVEREPRPVIVTFSQLQFRVDSAAQAFDIDDQARVFCLGVGHSQLPIMLAACLLYTSDAADE